MSSWLDGHAAADCCDITTTGRRSGVAHEVEIWFGVLDGAMTLICGNGPSTDWFRNMVADPHVRVRLAGEVHDGVARVVTDPVERRRVGELMGAKYVWGGDASIGLTYEKWCYEVPAVAIDFPVEPPR
jgi:deazaflavin-dependent oxidoreductase (nitroreductase family)